MPLYHQGKDDEVGACGKIAENDSNLPQLLSALVVAVFIIFFLMVYHFKRISTATLLLFSLMLCVCLAPPSA